ncbi:XrtY-associated glycosyltransferase XYAG1 [Spirosoma spitsbergense]|uniref:XrtY-associated glycosyltransferase XYAG1 n=1 Tax=Spirosoma spitsbergense TaxID=431554 RepID=UPI00037A8B21|nr:glycosyltransferase [Spirosoma spitsbergense]
MKILHVVPTYKPAYIYGGPIESIASLCESLLKDNKISVYTTNANGDKELPVVTGKGINVDGVTVTYFSRITRGNTNIAPALWTNLYRDCQSFDIVHIHSWWNPVVVIAAAICHLKKVKVVVSPRGMLSSYIMTKTYPGTKKWIHKLIGKDALQAAIFHATSESEYIECGKLIPNWTGFLLPNIIKLPSEQFNRTENEIFTLVFLSRIHPKKGLDILFKAISKIDAPIRLRIAGSGEKTYIEELKNESVVLKIDHLIEWIGWKDHSEKYDELASADLFVLTSHNENFANVVIESLYVGTPVLLSTAVGLADYVKENDLGWIVELDEVSITNGLLSAIADKKKRMSINSTGREKILESFSRDILAKKYMENYNQSIIND